MTPDANTIASILGTVATGGLAAWAARSAKRTKPQEKRDDFAILSDQQGRAIERLEARMVKRETEAEKQRERIADQDEAISWLLHRVRSLVGYVRKAGLEPPAPDPMSDRARQYIHNIDS